MVVVDEAYYEFAMRFADRRNVEYSRSLQHVRQGASVIVLRTFSKAHGLAGLRVGYGLGPAELLAYCARMRDTFSVSSAAQTAAIAALDDAKHIERVVSNNAEQAQILGVGLSESDTGWFPRQQTFFTAMLMKMLPYLRVDFGMKVSAYALSEHGEHPAVSE